MKKNKIIIMLLLACSMSVNMSATYYIVGNGNDDPNGKWCNGSNWGFQEMDENNSITFKGVAGGKNYGFKIKDSNSWSEGTEYTTFDYDNSDQPLYGGDGGDMGFRLTEDADVTVSFVDGKVRVKATKALAYRSNYYYIAGNTGVMGSWSENAVALTNDQITFTNLSADWYEFKITNGSWYKTWGYSKLDVANSSPMHKTYGESNNICFRIQANADVTVKMENGKVVLLIDREYCVTGIGGWAATTDYTLTQGNNYTYTFYNLSPGSYEFKVKEKVAAWEDDCTWGYDHLDTENSNSGENWSGNIGFNLSLPADVTIALVNNMIRLNVTPVYFIVGNGDESHGDWCNQKGWWTDDANSRLDATTLSKTYTALPAGTYEFKLTNGKWKGDGGTVWAANAVDNESSSRGYRGAGEEANIEFDLQAATDVTISFNPETGKISLVSSNGYFLSNVYSVVGEEALVGFNWDNMETSTEMTNNGDGTYTYTINHKYLAADDYDYKILGGHRWGNGCEYPNTNATLSIAEAGYYTVVFTLNPVAETQSCVATPVTKDVRISQYQYSTFYSDKAYRVPEGLTALIFTGIENDMLVMESIDVIPAETGVVLYGAANATFALAETEANVTYPDNMLHGTLENAVIDNSNVHYILGLSSAGECGMFWPAGTTEGVGAFTNQAGKAYLELPASGGGSAPARIRGFIFSSPSVATGVYDAEIQEADGACYDLLGRKVSNPQQGGLYIMNGKKIIIL